MSDHEALKEIDPTIQQGIDAASTDNNKVTETSTQPVLSVKCGIDGPQSDNPQGDIQSPQGDNPQGDNASQSDAHSKKRKVEEDQIAEVGIPQSDNVAHSKKRKVEEDQRAEVSLMKAEEVLCPIVPENEHKATTEATEAPEIAFEKRKHDIKKPKPVEETELVFIDKEEELICLVTDLKKEKVFSFDSEFWPFKRFNGCLCLLQISTETKDYLIDVMKLREKASVLNEVFADKSIRKVVHDGRNDVAWLREFCSIEIKNLFDTFVASYFLKLDGHSLKSIVKEYVNTDLSKEQQLADWTVRPLSQDMKNYARSDTHYLNSIYHCMFSELGEQLSDVLKKSEEVTSLQMKRKTFKEDSYKVKGYKSCNNKHQLYALKQICQWRFQEAQNADLYIKSLMLDSIMVKIARKLPGTVEEVEKSVSNPEMTRQRCEEVFNILEKARKL